MTLLHIGTESVWANTPCGIDVNTKVTPFPSSLAAATLTSFHQNIDICQAAREAIPGVPDLLKKSAGVCTCMPQVLKLAADSKAIAGVLEDGDVSAAGAEVLKMWGDANQVSGVTAVIEW